MATYFVASGGSNTSPYDTWAKAATSLQTALSAASSGSDIVVIQYNAVPSGDAELAADTAYTTANSVSIISASADDASTAYTPTAMGTANWIGNSTTNRYVRLDWGADDRVYCWGLTFRTAGSTDDRIRINGASQGADGRFDNCYFWSGNTTPSINIESGGNSVASVNRFRDCTFRFGATSQMLSIFNDSEFINCTIASAGSTPTTLIGPQPQCDARFTGCDLSIVTGTLVANSGARALFQFERCKFGAGVTVLATQTSNPTLSSASAFVSDCSSGDTHGIFGYYDALGSVVTDTSIYFTSGAAAQSWKIVTSANASVMRPFWTPYVDLYNTGSSAITPYFEILRDGSTTAYKDHEVYAEFSAKTTSGFTQASFSSDVATVANRLAVSGSNQANGAGLGSWTGESGTAWSGKIDSGSSMTPAENGAIRGRIAFGAASATVYVDPQIRT